MHGPKLHLFKPAIDYHVWSARLEKYSGLHPKPKTIAELKAALQTIWEEPSQVHINIQQGGGVANFKRLNIPASCVAAIGDHLKHLYSS